MSLQVELGALHRFFDSLDNAPAQAALMAEIGQSLAEASRLCFVDGQDPWGGPWLPLKFRDGQPLRDTGRLMNSITYFASGQKVEVGTDFSYASTHQFGATIKPVNAPGLVFQPRGFEHPIFAQEVTVPARPFLPIVESGAVHLPPEWAREVGEVVLDYLAVANV